MNAKTLVLYKVGSQWGPSLGPGLGPGPGSISRRKPGLCDLLVPSKAGCDAPRV